MAHDSTGTLRKNRIEKCPFTNPAKFMKLPRGSEEHFCDAESGIIAARWQDNGIVTIASSEYGVSPVVKAERYVASQKIRAAATEWLQNHGKKPSNLGRSRSVLSVAGVSPQMRYDNVGYNEGIGSMLDARDDDHLMHPQQACCPIAATTSLLRRCTYNEGIDATASRICLPRYNHNEKVDSMQPRRD
ncbi:piggyBac transposable element-derived protein 2-like [Scylla paramamosain]|uniref:piggyBac transposable element-derived protein 2-like n=1 Tax=Scylla paramamosain TaxID=85552 RepID=UPI0030833EF1